MTGKTPRALRLTFTYSGGAIRLVSRRSLQKLAPLSDSLASFAGRSGFWYELRDAGGAAIYRRVRENPLQTAPEAPAEGSEVALRRVQVSRPRARFVLLVPDLAEAHRLALVGSSGAGGAGPASDLAVFDLRPGPVS